MTGQYAHSIDAKGRLFIPAALRRELGQTFHVTMGQDHCLSVYSDESWAAFMDKLKALSYNEVKKLRALFAYAADCEPDAQGRILLPAGLRKYAELTKEAVITGVSGHAAQQIGRKLSAIAKKKQTLCVTHLPQIAAMGDHHLRISKSVRDGRSYTDVSPMDRAHRVDEIARLLSGEEISDAARRNAEELLDAAGQGA